MDAETAWKNHSTEIRRFIVSRLEDETIVQDILHDVYLKTTEQFDQLRDKGRYVPYPSATGKVTCALCQTFPISLIFRCSRP